MSFVHFNKNGWFVDKNGQDLFINGINFAPRYVCTDFWRDWRPDRIRAALDDVRSMQLNAVRIPVQWADFEPEEGIYSETMMERFAEFISFCREREIYVMPWFLVGVATGLYDVPWRNGRSFLFDESMVRAEENHLRQFASRFRDEEQILAWDICDEPEWYTRMENSPDTLPYPTEAFTAWVGRMYHAFKDTDPNHIVTLGFGHIGINDYGMDIPAIAEILDCMAVTTYNDPGCDVGDMPFNDAIMQYHLSVNRQNKPVYMCECPGNSSINVSDALIGRLYTMTLYGGLLRGCAGYLPWCLNDYEREIWKEYSLNRSPCEQGFGILDRFGNKKPAAEILEAFGIQMKDCRITEYDAEKPQAALVLPRSHGEVIHSRSIPAYLAFSKLSVPLDIRWVTRDFSEYPVIVISSMRGYKNEDWERILQYTERGGNVLCLAENDIHSPYMQELFGLRPFGTRSGHVKYELCGAEVLACYENGDPRVIKHTCGKGTVFCITDTLGRSCADDAVSAWIGRELDKFGIRRTCRSEDPLLEAGILMHRERDEALLILINHADEDIRTRVKVCDGTGTETVYEVSLPAWKAELRKIRFEK